MPDRRLRSVEPRSAEPESPLPAASGLLEAATDRPCHQVAVTALIVNERRQFLLLFRETEPRIWGAPGGRLESGEDVRLGLEREVAEETGLTVEVLAPVDARSVRFGGHDYVGLAFLARPVSGTLQLSAEHSDARWFDLAELEAAPFPISHALDNFRFALRLLTLFE